MKQFIISILKKLGYALVKINTTPASVIAEINAKTDTILKKVSPNNIILNGPFEGIHYIVEGIGESTILPKIVGSYESQLHNIVEAIITKNYGDIIDIGCAEGYYAIGFAKRMNNTTIHCFDINKKDIEICKQIAQLNNLQNLTYNYWCSKETLVNFQFKNKGLIFCDTEGFELELFTEDVVSNLQQHDFLIEIHDSINPSISNTLYNIFKKTHTIQVVNNRDVAYNDYKGLDMLTNEEKAFAFFEHRGGYNMNIKMEWYYITAKI
jgi:hypothetical protein